MDFKIDKDLLALCMQYDPLFLQLVRETEKEKDDSKFAVGLALVQLASIGKVRILQDTNGQLLFEPTLPN